MFFNQLLVWLKLFSCDLPPVIFSAEEITAALKATFAKALAADPSAAADIARALAEALAEAGASADEIAAVMNEAMAASLMASAGENPH